MTAKDIVAAADAKLAGMFPGNGRMTTDQVSRFWKLVDEEEAMKTVCPAHDLRDCEACGWVDGYRVVPLANP